MSLRDLVTLPGKARVGRQLEALGGGCQPGGGQPHDGPAPQGLSIVLADRNYTVSGVNPDVHFRVKAGSLHLVLDITIGSTYNLTLVWNKHMTVFIKMARASQVPCRTCWLPGARGSARPPDTGPHRTLCAACVAMPMAT